MCNKTKSMVVLVLAVLLGLAVNAQIPIPDGFPNENTTGIKGAGLSYSDLTPKDYSSSGWTIPQSGITIDKLDITGYLIVTGSNVTIKQCRITSSNPNKHTIRSEGTNLVLEDVEVDGNQGWGGAIVGGNYTARRCNFHNAVRTKASTNTLMEDCYIHDLFKGVHPQYGSTHNECIKNEGGTGITIRHNTLLGPYQASTSVITMNASGAPLKDVTIENNFMSGGSVMCNIQREDWGHGAPSNITIHNNILEKGSTVWKNDPDTPDHAYIGDLMSWYVITCNKFHTGELFAGNNRTCTTPVGNLQPNIPVLDDQVLVTPYPMVHTLSITCSAQRISAVTIYDDAGRRVKEIPGTNSYISWDGADYNGQTTSPGMYYYRIKTATGKTHSGKVLKVQ
jgi:hypothetical protein